MTYTVAALYRFVTIDNTDALRSVLREAFAPRLLCGTLLIAPEGINGTLAGSADAIDAMLNILEQHTGLTRDDVKFSEAPDKPFQRLKLRLKREIITFQQDKANPHELPGTYVAPRDWNNLIADPEITLLDTRNVYETMIGTFKGAADPGIERFTDFAGYVRSKLDPAKNKKIAMYCTGGIRCEKAAAFMRAEGFEEVYHLKGGILKYLEEVPAEESLWRGECYVFDRRVAVGQNLTTGRYVMCFSCGYALAAADREHPHFEEGVSCAHCHARTSDDDKARFRMRQQQLGASASPLSEAENQQL